MMRNLCKYDGHTDVGVNIQTYGFTQTKKQTDGYPNKEMHSQKDLQTMGQPWEEGEQRHRQSKGHADGPKDTDLLRKGKDIQTDRPKGM